MSLTEPLKFPAPAANKLNPSDTEDIRKRLGQRIREYRERKGYSQDVLAELSGLNRSYIGALERGEHNPGINNIVRVAEGLDVSIGQLFKEGPMEKKKPHPMNIEKPFPAKHAKIGRKQFLQLLEQCATDRPDLVVIYLERFGTEFVD